MCGQAEQSISHLLSCFFFWPPCRYAVGVVALECAFTGASYFIGELALVRFCVRASFALWIILVYTGDPEVLLAFILVPHP